MTMQSKELTLDQAGAGMTLACDLVNQHGAVLLQQGCVLTDTLLSALERHGIEHVRVLGASDADGGEPDAGLARARIEARLARLFRGASASAGAAAHLRASLQAYRLERRW